MRLVGVDFGARRIGIAMGETEVKIATARPPMIASGKLATDAQNLVNFMREEQAAAIVLGVPEHEYDERMAKICRRLGDEMVKLGAVVHFVDESFTSVEADSALKTTNLTAAGRRKLRDGEAACQILERYFERIQ